jgi:hypothetical protein
MATDKPTNGCSRVRNGQGRPRYATNRSQGISKKDVGAIKLPAGFARQEGTGWARTNQAKDVVIPQLGQGRPVADRNAQGHNPSCVCVPNPFGSGSSQRATTKIATRPIANKTSKIRVVLPNLSLVGSGGIMVRICPSKGCKCGQPNDRSQTRQPQFPRKSQSKSTSHRRHRSGSSPGQNRNRR